MELKEWKELPYQTTSINCTSLHLMVAQSMAHITEKWSDEGKGTEKWHKIHVIAEGKMSLSRVAVSLYTFIIERIKCEGKSIVRCSRRESKKSSTRLYDRVIVKERVQNKSHHLVHESRTFSKGQTWCKLTITPIRRALAKSRNHLTFGHSLQTFTTGVVKMLYPRDTEHIGYLELEYEREVQKYLVHACWSRTPGSTWKDI